MTATRARASLAAPETRPKAITQARLSVFMITIWIRLVQALGFSNGWEELALKMPPPLVPNCLIASWLATG